MAKLTGAHLMVRALKLEGIKKIFTLVGDTILPLVDAAEDEGIEFIDTRHEAAAMHMADGWARVTGEPAVALFTGGPGFSNAISALPNVYTAESPVIFISGSSPLSQKGMYSFQEIDQVEMAAPVTKGSWLVHDRRRIPDFVSTAFRTALSGRPGPVHLNVPLDIQEQVASEDELPRYNPGEYRTRGRSEGDPKLIQEAIALLNGAERPVVVVANPARYSLPPAILEEFIEVSGLPVFTIEQARGLISDDHPLCFGYADRAINGVARRFGEADVVLLLGKRLDFRYSFGQSPFFHADADLIQVDPEPAEIGRNRGVSVGVVGDIGAVVRQLAVAAKDQKWDRGRLSPWLDTLREDRRKWIEDLESKATDDLPLHPIRVFKELSDLADGNAILIFDGGDYVQWGRSYLRASGLGRWMRLGPLSQLGCGIPYAMAAKLARPDARVLLFIGDGSFGFYGMEYDTAIRHNIPITTILGNDSLWGIDRNFQLAYYGRAVATDLRSVRYDKVVEALGGHGEYVEKAEQIVPAIERAMESKQPSLVNVVIKSVRSPLADAMIANKLK